MFKLIRKAYDAFNSRDIDTALSTFHNDVEWPKAFEGGYVQGHEEIRSYWTRQWQEINPKVEPVRINEREDGTLEVTVHQNVKDLESNQLFDDLVKHIYTVQDGLLRRMDIEKSALWEFEIFDIFALKAEFIVLTGKLVSGGVLSNENNVLQKEISVSFVFNAVRLTKKVVRLDGWLQKPNQDLVADNGDNLALVLEKDYDLRFFDKVKLKGQPIRAILEEQ